VTFNHQVLKPIHLLDGITLLARSYITMPSDLLAHDPEIYAHPEKFDGFCFYDKRMSSRTNVNCHKFAIVGLKSLAFR
jgi:hypothetical protein